MASSNATSARFLLGCAGVVVATGVALLAWHLATQTLPPHVVPPLAAVGARLAQGDIWREALASGVILLLSFLRALVWGLPLGAIVGFTPIGAAVFYPVLRLLKMLPAVALVPPITLAVGLAPSPDGFNWPAVIAMTVVVAARTAVAVMTAQSATVRSAFSIPSWQEIRQVLASAAPRLFAGFREAIEWGAALLVTNEVLGTTGIGYQLMHAVMVFDPATAAAVVLVIWSMVICLEGLLFAAQAMSVVLWNRRQSN